MGLVGVVRVRVRGWVVHYTCESPHIDRSTRRCLCMYERWEQRRENENICVSNMIQQRVAASSLSGHW